MNYPPNWGGGPYGYYGPPYPPFMPVTAPPTEKQKTALEQIQDIEGHIEGLKKLKKYLTEDNKDDPKKTKKQRFDLSIGDVFSLLMIFSIPTIWLQVKLLNVAASLITLH